MSGVTAWVMGLNSSEVTPQLTEVLGVSFSFLFSFTALLLSTKYANNSPSVGMDTDQTVQKLPPGSGVTWSPKSFMCFASNIQCVFGILVLLSIYLGLVKSLSEFIQKMA